MYSVHPDLSMFAYQRKLQVITGVTLELKLSNDTSFPIGLPANAYPLLDRVEVLAEGGNQVIARYESSALLFPFRHIDALSYERYALGFECKM